jgi:hypothetical protein
MRFLTKPMGITSRDAPEAETVLNGRQANEPCHEFWEPNVLVLENVCNLSLDDIALACPSDGFAVIISSSAALRD